MARKRKTKKSSAFNRFMAKHRRMGYSMSEIGKMWQKKKYGTSAQRRTTRQMNYKYAWMAPVRRKKGTRKKIAHLSSKLALRKVKEINNAIKKLGNVSKRLEEYAKKAHEREETRAARQALFKINALDREVARLQKLKTKIESGKGTHSVLKTPVSSSASTVIGGQGAWGRRGGWERKAASASTSAVDDTDDVPMYDTDPDMDLASTRGYRRFMKAMRAKGMSFKKALGLWRRMSAAGKKKWARGGRKSKKASAYKRHPKKRASAKRRSKKRASAKRHYAPKRHVKKHHAKKRHGKKRKARRDYGEYRSGGGWY